MELFYILGGFYFLHLQTLFLERAYKLKPLLECQRHGKIPPYQSKGRQLRGKIKVDLNEVGEEKKYFKSQDKSGCNAHFHIVWSS